MISYFVRLGASLFLFTLSVTSYASYMELDGEKRGEKRKRVEQNTPNKRARHDLKDIENAEKLNTIFKLRLEGKARDDQIIWAGQYLENRTRTPKETMDLCNIYRHHTQLFENAYQRALECCDDVLENHPTPKDKVWALTNKGKIFSRMYDDDPQIVDNQLTELHFLRCACEVEGADRTTAYKLYTNSLLSYGKIRDILQFLEKQTERDPTPYLYLRWACLLSKPELNVYDPKKTIRICQKAIQDKAASCKLYNLYAGIYKYELKNNEEAIRILEEGVREFADSPDLFCSLATLYRNENKPKAALEVCKEGLKNSNDAELYYLAASICTQLTDSIKEASEKKKIASDALWYFKKAKQYADSTMKDKLDQSRHTIKSMEHIVTRKACPW